LAKRRVFSVHAMKAYKVSKDMAPLDLNLGSRWNRFVQFMSQPLYSRKRTTGTLSVGGSVDSRAVLGVLEKRENSRVEELSKIEIKYVVSWPRFGRIRPEQKR
jgi:hypothetical protein